MGYRTIRCSAAPGMSAFARATRYAGYSRAWWRNALRLALTGFSLGFERTIAYVTREVLKVRSSGQAKSRPAARNPDGGECFNNRPVIGSGN